MQTATLEKSPPSDALSSAVSNIVRLDEATRARLRESDGLVAVAQACVIDCHDMAVVAKENLDSVIAFRKDLEARRKKFVEPAMQIIENAKAEYNPSIKAAEEAERIYRDRLGGYQLAQQRALEDQRRKQAEEERRRREEAERQAAAARARAEEQARESRRKVEEAAAAQRKAQEEGNSRAAAAAAAARAKAEEEERQKREHADRDADRIRMEAAATAPSAVVQETQKIAGLGSRDKWVVELTSASPEQALQLICEAVCGIQIADGAPRPVVVPGLRRTDLLALIKFDESAAAKLAGALKTAFNVPGYRAVNRPVPVNRKG